MSGNNKTRTDQRTLQGGQRFVALIAAAVVLLIAITFIGISQASRLGAAGPQLPPAKATLLAQGDATVAAARAQNPHPAKPPYSPPVAVPTATFTSGIYYFAGDAKFPNFNTNDMYRGQVNGTWEFVYVGSDTTNPAADVGAVRVETYSSANGYQLVGVFDAPDHSTYIGITGITGNVLRIKSDKTASFGFDLTTNTFSS
ncbi:MAG TPA: hypothetical protein VH591_19105 [Ktedonobacterales bacterium]|jgi:hypothetical protein